MTEHTVRMCERTFFTLSEWFLRAGLFTGFLICATVHTALMWIQQELS